MPKGEMRGRMTVLLSVPIEVERYIEVVGKDGDRVPSGAASIAEDRLIRMIESGELNWEWEWNDD